VLRIVVKENFSRDMAEMLTKDLHWALKTLDANGFKFAAKEQGAKRHRIC